jgi:hypothetical protein
MSTPEPTAAPELTAESPAPAQEPAPQQPPAETPKPEIDWKAEARKWEARAKEYKPAADKLAEIEEASKTELQRAQERAEAAERRAQKLESDKQIADWRSSIGKEFGVPAGVLRGTTEDELRAHAEELKALLPDPEARPGTYVAGEGRTSTATPSPADEFAALISKQLNGQR